MNTETLGKTTIWPASLGATTIMGCLMLACIFPFAAFATLAALTMKPRNGLALVTSVWAVNQAVGFLLLSFPWDAQAVGHGIAIFGATLLAFGAAHLVLRQNFASLTLRAGAALAAAFAVHQVALRAYAGYGGGAENFSAEIITAVGINDLLWFTGLISLRYIIAYMTGEKAISQIAPAQ
ncbi:hypothetical protein [Alterisphingorhabdus coralli]|uniref:Uncharacterized protein n=1 Tax=Alterisphingorhabdus coralli TaxID=3071408 RepID=A0AA97I0U9_9SPHN|nr:hypothetical protein [Parasphingorhabdus sp. SCSIO 66989]WOE74580.1 hypothetical protein RB602_12085 [Parasphingorhabdus sp. SCSIO 66989]